MQFAICFFLKTNYLSVDEESLKYKIVAWSSEVTQAKILRQSQRSVYLLMPYLNSCTIFACAKGFWRLAVFLSMRLLKAAIFLPLCLWLLRYEQWWHLYKNVCVRPIYHESFAQRASAFKEESSFVALFQPFFFSELHFCLIWYTHKHIVMHQLLFKQNDFATMSQNALKHTQFYQAFSLAPPLR